MITGNEIGDEGAKAIAQALERNTSLQEIHLEGMCHAAMCDSANTDNAIGVEGLSAMAQALQRNTSLQHLDLDLDGRSCTRSHSSVRDVCAVSPLTLAHSSYFS